MNKVFKVIWSEARNAYVVVSEMAKSHGTKSCSTKKLLAMLIATGVMTCASMAPAMADNLTDTKTQPKMIGYQQKWNTDEGILGTSIQAYQSQGNSLQLNMLRFEQYTTPKGENALAIRLGANIDGANKSGNIYLVDKNTKNQTLTTTINGSVIKTVLTDTDDKKVESSVDIGGYVDKTVKKAKTEVKAGENVTSVFKETGANGQDIYTINAKDTTYVAGNGIVINGENNAISVKLKEGESNLQVTDAGLELKKDLTVNSVNAGDYFFDAERGVGFGGEAYVTQSGLNANNKVITNVAAGEADTDAVNVAQLKKVVAAGDTDVHIKAGEYKVDDKNKVAMNLVDKAGNDEGTVTITGVAKAEDVAVVYDKNKTSLRSTNASVAENAIALGKGASAVKNSIAIGNGAYTQDGTLTRGQSVALGNGAVTGAKSTSIGSNAVGGREGTITIGANANNGSLYATVIGTDSKVNYMTRNSGAAATIVGAKSEIKNDNKSYSGVANGIFGSANTIENSNGVTIQGSGNTVTNAYKNMSGGDFDLGGVYVKKDAGAVGVIGGMNTVSNQIYTNVIGFGNTVAGDADNISHDVFVAGSRNNLSKVSDSIVMGNDNEISDRSNVISLGHENSIKANNAVAIGNGASVSAEGGVALGIGSVADRANAVSVGSTGANRQIINVAAGEADTDAVNVSQLNAVKETANKGWNLSTNGGEASKVAPDATVDFSGDKNISVSHDGTKVQVELNKNIDVNYVQTNALNAKYNLSVGTANENGTVPFLVSSTGAFYAANNNFSVDKDGKVIATAGEIGNVLLQNGVYTGNSVLRDGELYVGDASGNYSQITTTGAKLGQVTIAADGKISGVAAGEVSKTSTDAINGSQLHQTNENVAALDKRVTQNEADIAQNKADIAQNKADIAQNKADIAQNKADIAQNKADIAQNKADIAQNKADIAQNKADIAQNKADIAQNKADIATNKADIATNKANIAQNAADIKNVEALAKKHTTVAAGDNITVSDVGPNAEGGKEYKVALNNDITVQSVKAGDTTISGKGLEIKNGPSVTKDGVDAGGKKITNVAPGELSATSKDAVNGSQLYKTNQEVANNSMRINKLGDRVNKVGAGAAALAALHPMDFDPDDKLTFSAGYGNYGGENAAAIGAYYRPDEKVMFSVAGTVGNGENMVNAGVSFALDRTNHVSNSRTALAREVIDLRGQLAVMGAKMAKMEKAFGMLDETKTKLFPDVPANHWAYEYIAKLAGNGYIEGYPDGNFGGDRLMTRYEFAAMLYRAIEKGAALEEKIIKEFEPELGRIRVDRISGEDGDRDKIERVRVNDTKGERDHYGNKLAK